MKGSWCVINKYKGAIVGDESSTKLTAATIFYAEYFQNNILFQIMICNNGGIPCLIDFSIRAHALFMHHTFCMMYLIFVCMAGIRRALAGVNNMPSANYLHAEVN